MKKTQHSSTIQPANHRRPANMNPLAKACCGIGILLVVIFIAHQNLSSWDGFPPDHSHHSSIAHPGHLKCPYRMIENQTISYLGSFKTYRSPLPTDITSIVSGQWTSIRMTQILYRCHWRSPIVLDISTYYVSPLLEGTKRPPVPDDGLNHDNKTLDCPWYRWNGTYVREFRSVVRRNKTVRFHVGSSTFFDFTFPSWVCTTPPCPTIDPNGLWVPTAAPPSLCLGWQLASVRLIGTVKADPETYHMDGLYGYPVPLRKSCTFKICSHFALLLPTGDLIAINTSSRLSSLLQNYPSCSITLHRASNFKFDPRGIASELLDFRQYYTCLLALSFYHANEAIPHLMLPIIQPYSSSSLFRYRLKNNRLTPYLVGENPQVSTDLSALMAEETLNTAGRLLFLPTPDTAYSRYEFQSEWSRMGELIRQLEETTPAPRKLESPKPGRLSQGTIINWKFTVVSVLIGGVVLLTLDRCIGGPLQSSRLREGIFNAPSRHNTSLTRKSPKTKKLEVWSNPSRRIAWNCPCRRNPAKSKGPSVKRRTSLSAQRTRSSSS